MLFKQDTTLDNALKWRREHPSYAVYAAPQNTVPYCIWKRDRDKAAQSAARLE